jgi:hypothetical protein
MPYGTHYYSVTDVSLNGFTVRTTESTESVGVFRGIADNATNVPADFSNPNFDTIGFYSPCGETYNEDLATNLVQERLVAGDSGGFVYQFDTTNVADNDFTIPARHLTPVIDGEEPDLFKRWHSIAVNAEGTVGGAMKVSYRVDNFDTSETGWTDFTFDLTTQSTEKTFYTNKTSRQIQYKFHNFEDDQFNVRSYKIIQPQVLGDR